MQNEYDESVCFICGGPYENDTYTCNICEECHDKECAKLLAAREEYAKTAKIEVRKERYRMRDLRDAAISNAHNQRGAYNDRKGIIDDFRGDPDDDETIGRWIVNLLRHSFTNYEAILDGVPNETENYCPELAELGEWRDDAYRIIRKRVHAELRRVYPRIAALKYADLDGLV